MTNVANVSLPADVTRCTGHSGRHEDNYALCSVRGHCARHTDYFAMHLPINQPVSRMYAPADCELFIEEELLTAEANTP